MRVTVRLSAEGCLDMSWYQNAAFYAAPRSVEVSRIPCLQLPASQPPAGHASICIVTSAAAAHADCCALHTRWLPCRCHVLAWATAYQVAAGCAPECTPGRQSAAVAGDWRCAAPLTASCSCPSRWWARCWDLRRRACSLRFWVASAAVSSPEGQQITGISQTVSHVTTVLLGASAP